MHTLVYGGGGKGFGNRQTHRGVLRGVIIACERLPVFHMRIKRVSARSRAAADPAAHVREGNCTSAGAGSGAQSYVNLEEKKKGKNGWRGRGSASKTGRRYSGGGGGGDGR